jgi:hypothetical protein
MSSLPFLIFPIISRSYFTLYFLIWNSRIAKEFCPRTAFIPWFEKGIYPPGTMGFRLQVGQALEVLKLERERGMGERKALQLHSGVAAVLKKAEEYQRRERAGAVRKNWTSEVRNIIISHKISIEGDKMRENNGAS